MSGWIRQTPPLAEIQMTTLNTPLMALTMDNSRKEHDANAPYQRGSVWTADQQRNLIRSLLLGVPVGAIIRAKKLRNQGEAYYRIVDGKQRAEAIWAFVDDELAVPADWFPDRSVDTASVTGDGNVLYSGLTAYGRRSFESHPIAMIELTSDSETLEVPEGTGTNGVALQYVVRRRTADEAIAYEAMVYGLINTGGTAQTDADLANAARIANS